MVSDGMKTRIDLMEHNNVVIGAEIMLCKKILLKKGLN